MFKNKNSFEDSPSNINDTMQENSYPDSDYPTPKLIDNKFNRASIPYSFTPMNGAPSVKGKKLTQFSKKVRQSYS